MSDSLENLVEQFCVLLLQGNADLSGVTITRTNEDSEPGANRIVCRSSPRQIELAGITPSQPVAWGIPVSFDIHLAERDAGKLDEWTAAVQASLAFGSGIPTAAQTFANANFPNGLQCYDSDEGALDHSDNVRNRTKTFRFVTPA